MQASTMHTKSCWWRSSFPDAEAKGIEDTTVNVWEDNWDDDAKEDDFANQLRWDSLGIWCCLCVWMKTGKNKKQSSTTDLC